MTAEEALIEVHKLLGDSGCIREGAAKTCGIYRGDKWIMLMSGDTWQEVIDKLKGHTK